MSRIAVAMPIGGQFSIYERSNTYGRGYIDEDQWCVCERCCKEIRKRNAIYGYGEHSEEPYCEECVDWFEEECERTGEENIFFH